MANQWLRLWHEMPTDPKFRTVARVAEQPVALVISIFLHLLVAASVCPDRGDASALSVEDVATALDVSEADVEAILAAMQGRLLDGRRVTGWKKRQPEREDNSRDRVAAHRARKRNARATTETPSQSVKREVTQRNAPDKDKDKDKEREGLPAPLLEAVAQCCFGLPASECPPGTHAGIELAVDDCVCSAITVTEIESMLAAWTFRDLPRPKQVATEVLRMRGATARGEARDREELRRYAGDPLDLDDAVRDGRVPRRRRLPDGVRHASTPDPLDLEDERVLREIG